VKTEVRKLFILDNCKYGNGAKGWAYDEIKVDKMFAYVLIF